jgi:hypothetical protein
MSEENGWTGKWIAEKVEKCEEVESISITDSNILNIVRKAHPPIVVATLAEATVSVEAVRQALGHRENVQFVVNVPKVSYVTGPALDYAKNEGFAIGGLGDLMRALSIPDVTQYVPKTIAFIERGLRQHDRVHSFERRADLYYLIHRRNSLKDVLVVFLHEYELVADHLRVARDRYGRFDIVVITDPNGNATTEAEAVAEEFGCRIYKWGKFLGALNRQ